MFILQPLQLSKKRAPRRKSYRADVFTESLELAAQFQLLPYFFGIRPGYIGRTRKNMDRHAKSARVKFRHSNFSKDSRDKTEVPDPLVVKCGKFT